jgi:hypothetical protein
MLQSGATISLEQDTPELQARRTFTRLVEAKRTPEGLRLERYLRFAFARKALFPSNARGFQS